VSDPFLAEIRIFPFQFAPTGWAKCDGQLLPIAQHTALFSLLGTTYGGNGTTNFALPNLQGRTPLSAGAGPGLTPRALGEWVGDQTVTLLQSEIPTHGHQLMASKDAAEANDAYGTRVLARTVNGGMFQTAPVNAMLGGAALAPVGGDVPHENRQPYLTLNFCIAMQGIFPPRP
jgi:microcystin-dependent protein